MAEKGNLFLKNEAVIGLYDATKAYEATAQEALYSQYKIAFKISTSNYFRGDAANSFKNYITNGTINIISGFLDLFAELSMITQLIAEVFFEYEKNHKGMVEEGALDYINQTLDAKESILEEARGELDEVLRLASKYITTKGLSLDSVNAGYAETRDVIKTIREDLYAVDDELVITVNELMGRIAELRTLIENIMSFCYSSDGRISADKLDLIQNQDWFHPMSNITLYLLLEEDPFEYVAGESTLSEEQWAAGLCSDVYTYAGYSFHTMSGEAGIENGTAYAEGAYRLLNANAYAQFTDYLSAQANVNVIYAEGEAKAAWSEDYKGFKAEAGVGILQADASVVLGSDDINAFVKGEVKLLCADAKVACEWEDDGEYAIGVGASATAASANATGGTTIFSYKDKDSATGDPKPLLGFDVGVGAKLGGSFMVWSESETAIEMEYININATTLEIDLAFLVEVEISLTVPTLYFKELW